MVFLTSHPNEVTCGPLPADCRWFTGGVFLSTTDCRTNEQHVYNGDVMWKTQNKRHPCCCSGQCCSYPTGEKNNRSTIFESFILYSILPSPSTHPSNNMFLHRVWLFFPLSCVSFSRIRSLLYLQFYNPWRYGCVCSNNSSYIDDNCVLQ